MHRIAFAALAGCLVLASGCVVAPATSAPGGSVPTSAAESADAAASAGAAGIGDPYFPDMGNGGYEVAHYAIDLVVDVPADVISGTATISAHALQDLSRLNLDYEGPAIREALLNGAPCQVDRYGGELTLTPAEPLPAGEPFTATVSYAGRPGAHRADGDDRYALGWYHYGDGTLVASEPIGAATWYPVNDHPSDKATYTLRVTVDAPWEVAANGVFVAVQSRGGQRTYVWEETSPMASYLATVAIADWEVDAPGSVGGVPIRNYFYAGIPAGIRAAYADIGAMMAYFQETLGPYPFEAYGVVVHDVDLGFALETQTLSTFGSGEPRYLTVSHELAHQWFGNSVSPATWQDVWLNEGLATYAGYLWQEHTEGPAAAAAALLDRYQTLVADYPRVSYSPAELATRVARLPLGARVLPAGQARVALTALIGEVLGADEIEALVAGAPAAGTALVAASALPALVASAPFAQVTLGMEPWNAFVEAVGMPEEAFAVGDPGPLDLFDWRVYQRGALALHALRTRVGDGTFFAILRAWVERFRYGTATTDDWVALCSEISRQDLGAFFHAWLFETALPPIPELGWEPSL